VNYERKKKSAIFYKTLFTLLADTGTLYEQLVGSC